MFYLKLACRKNCALSCQDIFQQNIGRTGPQFPGASLSKAPLSSSNNSGRPPGKKKGPKPKEVLGGLGSPGTKKKNQKGVLKAEAGELDLIEIHTKHTLKKFQPGKSKHKNKVWSLQTYSVFACLCELMFHHRMTVFTIFLSSWSCH